MKGGSSAVAGKERHSTTNRVLKWSKGYSIGTVGPRSLEAVREYLRSQPSKHPNEVITDWAGDPGAVEQYGVRFSRPIPVPDDDKGAELIVGGQVTEKLDGRRVSVTLEARSGGDKVLTAARAIVRLK